MLSDNIGTDDAHDVPQDQRGDNSIVQGPEKRHEVRDEINR